MLNGRLQSTIAEPVSFAGCGLHSGAACRVTISPSSTPEGLIFRQQLRPGIYAPVRAHWSHVSKTPLCTHLRAANGADILTIEHILAALSGCGIYNAVIDVDGPEIPILDGSAAPFVTGILSKGRKTLNTAQRVIRILRPVSVQEKTAEVRIEPCDGFEMQFDIAFADKAIGTQSLFLDLGRSPFARELSHCRTFCLKSDIAPMRARGLAQGGSLENAIVFDDGTVLSTGGLRCADEPVRHKMLDALGDLTLAGLPILGRFTGLRSGHALTHRLLQKLFASPENFDIFECDEKTAKMLGRPQIYVPDLLKVA